MSQLILLNLAFKVLKKISIFPLSLFMYKQDKQLLLSFGEMLPAGEHLRNLKKKEKKCSEGNM